MWRVTVTCPINAGDALTHLFYCISFEDSRPVNSYVFLLDTILLYFDWWYETIRCGRYAYNKGSTKRIAGEKLIFYDMCK